MTVHRLRDEMPASEYLDWGRFLRWRQREERWQHQRASAAARRRTATGGAQGGGR